MRRMLVLAVAVAGLALGGCGGGDDDGTPTPSGSGSAVPASATPTARPAVTVSVDDNTYDPGVVSAPVGTTITWKWTGANPHSVTGTFDGKKVESPTQVSGEFTFTFEKSGTFSYQCAVHGRAMSGDIKIEGGG